MTEIAEKSGEIDPPKPTDSTLPARDMVRVTQDIHLAWSDDPRFISSYPLVKAQNSEVLRGLMAGEISIQDATEIFTAQQLEQQMAGEKDPLTNAYNRRAGEILLDFAVASSRRTGKSITVLMMDLDKFHDINNDLDHDGGDAVLKAVSEHAQSQVRRENDYLIRWGGEEFLLLMQGTDEEGIRDIVNGIRSTMPSAVEESISNQGYNLGRNVTFSGGLASLSVERDDLRKPEEIWPDLIKKADQRLHIAKENGRNQIVGSKEQPNG